MSKFIIRNDDVAFDTSLSEITQLCEICDRHGFQLLHAVVPIGEVKKIKSSRMSNDEIKSLSSRLFSENKEVLEYLRGRNDLIGVHGLWHTHKPTEEEIMNAKIILQGLGFNPTYFIPPFNEGEYTDEIHGLKLSKLSWRNGERLEDFLEKGKPKAEIMYLHGWRFDNDLFTFEMLDRCLERLKGASKKLNLGCKHRKLNGFDNLDKIFGWTFQEGLMNYADDSVEGITISHALMFLTEEEIATFMKEAWRVLEDNGVIRITEDDTENVSSSMYQTGCVASGPRCMTGPLMMRKLLEGAGFKVYDVDRDTTHFYDRSLMQAYRGGEPERFFIEGVKEDQRQ